MNTHTTNLSFKGFSAILALMASGAGWAGDHILIVTGGAAVTNTSGVVTSAGSVSTPITITVPGVNSGNAVTYGTGQTLTLQTLPVKMCKPGTNGNLEWLDQGTSIIGATGTLNSATPTNIQGSFINRLVLSQSNLIDNYAASNGVCTSAGSLSYSVTRTAEIQARNGDSANFSTQFTGSFSFGNVVSGVPEPGTLAMMSLGLAALGWMGAKRARKSRANAV